MPQLSPKSLAVFALIPGLAAVFSACTPSTDSYRSDDVNRKSAAFEREADTGKYFYITTGRKRPAKPGTGEYEAGEEIQYSSKPQEGEKPAKGEKKLNEGAVDEKGQIRNETPKKAG